MKLQTHSDVVVIVDVVVIIADEVSTALVVENVEDVVVDEVVSTIRL